MPSLLYVSHCAAGGGSTTFQSNLVPYFLEVELVVTRRFGQCLYEFSLLLVLNLYPIIGIGRSVMSFV